MAEPTSSDLDKLAPEILREIFSFLPKPSLLRLRSVNSVINAIAAPLAFRHIQLTASKDKPHVAGFVQVARSEKLRGFVREVTCDTGLGQYFYSQWQGERREKPHEFMNALPYLRCFHNLAALHMRFTQDCGEENEDKVKDFETNDVRYWVLDVAFQCLAGTWSAERQQGINSGLDLDIKFDHDSGMLQNEQINVPRPLRELTVSNLGDFHDKRLTESLAFKTVLSLPTLKKLKLFIALETDEAAPENDFYFKGRYDFFESLPSTWLSPSVAGNLSTLSLFCREYWGWNPKMDFRAIRPGRGTDSGFPNLRVLALGRFVFSHEWQVEWFASLGRQNKFGGLEELYLDDCRIMFHGRHENIMDHGDTVVGKGVDGKDVVISNEGYHSKSLIRQGPTVRNYNATLRPREYPLRWSRVLSAWRKSMAALKVFKMGHGPLFHSEYTCNRLLSADSVQSIEDAMEYTQNPEEELYTGQDYRETAFRGYDCPTPPPKDAKPIEINIAKYAQGCGLSQERYETLRYLCFSGNAWALGGWPWGEAIDEETKWFPDGPKLEIGTRAMDEGALEALLSTVEARRKRG